MKKIFLIISILSLTFCLFSCNSTEMEAVESDEITDNLTISLSSSEVVVNEQYVSQTITAEVLPVTLLSKYMKVDWSVRWEDESITDSVDDYIEVIPESDGSCTASVRCYKAFTGKNIIITVTTRNGNYSADCICSYVGKPSILNHDISNVISSYDSNWNCDVYDLLTGNTFFYSLTLDNIFGEVTSSFVPEYTVSYEYFGNIICQRNQYNEAGDSISNTSSKTCTLSSSISNGRTSVFVNFEDFESENLAEIWITNGKVYVQIIDGIDSFSYVDYDNHNQKVEYSPIGYEDNKLPYIAVTVTEENTGITHTINFRPLQSVESISVNESIEF